MPIKYKIDVIQALKDKGFNTNRIRKEGLFGEATMSKLRKGEPVSFDTLGKLCEYLECQVSDIVEYVKE